MVSASGVCVCVMQGSVGNCEYGLNFQVVFARWNYGTSSVYGRPFIIHLLIILHADIYKRIKRASLKGTLSAISLAVAVDGCEGTIWANFLDLG